MFCLFNHTIFSLAQHLVTLVKIEQISVANHLFYCVDPPDFFLTLVKVVDSEFVRKYQHEGIDHCTVVV
jgi:hypothetical protein